MAFAGKHVLFLVENCSVPFDKRVWREALALKEFGASVSVVCPKGFKEDREAFVQQNGVNIYRYTLPINVYSKIGYVIEYAKAFVFSLYYVLRIHLRSRIHVVHVANPPDIFFALGWICRVLRIKFVFDHHDLAPESYAVKFNGSRGFLFKMMLLCERLTFRAAHVVVSTNESLKNIARTRGDLPDERIAIVRNGPDSAFRFRDDLKPYQKNGFAFLVSYIGIMGFTDGVELIVYAADFVCNECGRKDIEFVLIGYGDQFDAVRALVVEKKLERNVKLTNRISDADARGILSSSDICLAPDPRNGLNEFHTMNKIAEYMSFGKPIVSFDLDETKFTADESAHIVSDNDPKEFGRAIIALLDDGSKRAKMGEIGRQRLESQFTWEHSKNELRRIYHYIFTQLS